MGIDFAEALVLIGAVLAVAAALSGWFRGTVLSISVLSVAAGIGLSLAGVISTSPGDEGVIEVIEVIELALVLTLFTDGLVVERELVQSHWIERRLEAG